MKNFTLIFSLLFFLFLGCELQEEDEQAQESDSCEATILTAFDMSSVDLTSDFIRLNVDSVGVVTASTCQEFNINEGDRDTEVMRSITRSGSSLAIVDQDGDQTDFTIDGTNIIYPEVDVTVDGCSVFIRMNGELKSADGEIIITATMGYKGESCRELSMSSFL